MFIWMPESKGPLVSLKLVGRLTDADYLDTLPMLVDIAEREGALRVVADLSEFDGWEWQASYDKAAFGINHWDKVRRIALVGTLGWATLAARIAVTVATAGVRIFDAGKYEDALAWARSDEPDPPV